MLEWRHSIWNDRHRYLQYSIQISITRDTAAARDAYRAAHAWESALSQRALVDLYHISLEYRWVLGEIRFVLGRRAHFQIRSRIYQRGKRAGRSARGDSAR